ncbi:MAG: protein kinase [Vicinamibacterales bacterium]|jgi:serine/threonine-protein kinase|nr:protein kinase [Vicinamibacterales bacterium]
MPLTPGTALGPYTIESPLGAGGMGEVYRARDTRLDRTVAVKVLPAHIAADPDARERFEREAKAVAALNHPHICTLHDIGREDGTDFLVLELLEGESLAQRLEQGALPLEQALRIGIEIADALDKAHRQGIVHRDLKPGNIMLTKSGAKLLDFGLAKLGVPAHESGLSALATQGPSLTQEGTILGTFQYMAPEQLEGQEADARTDLFAFGTTLYEMITGRKAFEGGSQASLISAIMSGQPAPIGSLQPVSPQALDHAVTTCLEKDPDERWQAAGDLKRQLSWIAGGGAVVESSVPVSQAVAPASTWRRTLPWGVAAIGLVAAAALWTTRPERDASLTQVSVGVQPAERLGGRSRSVTARTAFALTADGRTLFFVAGSDDEDDRRLYRRDLVEANAVPVEGTEGGLLPFLSPEGQWVGFWAAGELRKAPTAGGPPVTIAAVSRVPSGARWGPDDRIVFDQQDGLFQVSADGGMPEPLTEVDRELGDFQHLLPGMLPGGDAVLFTVQKAAFRWDDADVVVQRLSTGTRTVLVENAADSRYVDTGHLLFVRLGTLMAVPFDLERLETTGGAVALIEGVTQAVNVTNSGADTGAAQFDLSGSGTLVYLPGGIATDIRSIVVWVDRRGVEEPLLAEPSNYFSVRLSPDGERLAYTGLGSTGGVWVHDLRRGGTTRLAEGLSSTAIWTPDGRDVTFNRIESELPNLFSRVADGSRPTERLTTSESFQGPGSWSPDGQDLIFADGGDISVLHVDGVVGERTQEPLVATPGFRSMHPSLSRDGRWLAFTSDDTGREEVYVQPYPGSGGRQQISTQGGNAPAWSPDGRELFYIAPPEGDESRPQMMVVDITTEPTVEAGRPLALFDWRYASSRPNRAWDVSPDGQRFLAALAVDDDERGPELRGHLRLIVNWTEELKERVPGG